MAYIGEELATIDDAFNSSSIYDQYLARKEEENKDKIEQLKHDQESSFLEQFGRTMKDAKIELAPVKPVKRLNEFICGFNGYFFHYDKLLGKWEVSRLDSKTFSYVPVVEDFFAIALPESTPESVVEQP